MLGRPPIGGPFPDIADHVANAITVRRKSSDRRRALITVLAEVLKRKVALPGIRHVPAARRQFAAPCKLRTFKSAPRGILPLCFRRQFLAGPFRIGFGVAIRDVNNRMVVETADRTARTVGPSPIGAELEAPPLTPVSEIDGLPRRRENE